MNITRYDVQVCKLCGAVITNMPDDIIAHFTFTHHFSNKIIHIDDNTVETKPKDVFLALMYRNLRNF